MISIITPCFNSAKFINDTIDSVLSQTYTDWEWIITDDCSTDNSLEIIRSYNNPRIKIIELKKNSGAAFAYNSSLENATRRYITFIDSDDVWKPQFLEKMLGFMIKENAELVYSSYSRYDEKMKPFLSDFKATKEVTFNNLLYTCRLSTLSTMYDSKRIGKVFFPYDNKREDYSMWLTLLKKIPVGKPLSETLSIYRIRKGSLSRNKLEMFKCQYKLYRNFLNFNALKASYYTFFWALNGFVKYNPLM